MPHAQRRQLPLTTFHLKSTATDHISPQVNCHPPHFTSSQLPPATFHLNSTDPPGTGYDPHKMGTCQHGRVQLFHQRSTCNTQLTLWPHVAHVSSRISRISAGWTHACTTEWYDREHVVNHTLKRDRLQGSLAQKNPPTPQDPTVGLFLVTYGGPRAGGCFL